MSSENNIAVNSGTDILTARPQARRLARAVDFAEAEITVITTALSVRLLNEPFTIQSAPGCGTTVCAHPVHRASPEPPRGQSAVALPVRRRLPIRKASMP